MGEKILLEDLAKEQQVNFEHRIVLAKLNGKLYELSKTIDEEIKENVTFITTADNSGNLTYKRSATLLLLKAVYDVVPREKFERFKVEYSLSKGLYCTLTGDVKLDKELAAQIEARMRELVALDLPIVKTSMNVRDAIEMFAKNGMHDKERLLKYRRSSKVNVYMLDGYTDYFYGYMVPSTGYIKAFSLHLYDEGIVLQLPVKKAPEDVPEFAPQNKIFNVLKEATSWSTMLGVETVGALNDLIASGEIGELILVQEALQEKKLGDIAKEIASDSRRKFIMMAGPSSSGKTTTSYRMAIQLRAHGLKPHQLSLDNYYLDREFTPRDEDGNYDFECLEALDVEQFNKDMLALMNHETVEIPEFNFKTGKREYHGNFMTLGENDVMVIEGIHGLNDKLSYTLPRESKYKIYLSALTQLNIDEHNRIPTTDGRLLRRIVRDARTRGTSAAQTIAMWESVRRGEENYIFPFQEDADVMFNSALIYELAVLKQYAEPLLFSITPEMPEYDEAKRLLKFLDYFLGVNADWIPHTSILREFVGGSFFKV